MTHRIESVENGPSVLFEDGVIMAMGSRELCEAVRDGTVAAYIETSRSERERIGAGEYSKRDIKFMAARATPEKAPAAPKRRAEQLALF